VVLAADVIRIGATTSLGPGAVPSFAAARAGVQRATDLPGFSTYDDEAEDVDSFRGHAVAGAEGFAGLGRLARLGSAALRDAVGAGRIESSALAEASLALSLSSGYYRAAADAQRSGGEAVPEPPPSTASWYADRLVPRIFALADLPTPARGECYLQDHAGWVTAMTSAIGLLETGAAPQCLVGAIDSLLDTETIEALAALDRLKGPQQPLGVLPGEAAAFVLLGRGAELGPGPVVLATAMRQEPRHLLADEPPDGRILAEVVVECLEAARCDPNDVGLVIGNLDGTNRTAHEWGSALSRLPRALAAAPHWHPIESFGDTGAAHGGLAFCQAVRALERGYAGTARVLLWLASPGGARGALLIAAGRE